MSSSFVESTISHSPSTIDATVDHGEIFGLTSTFDDEPLRDAQPKLNSEIVKNSQKTEGKRDEMNKQEAGDNLNDDDYDDDEETFKSQNIDDKASRVRRASDVKGEIWGKLVPGACIKGCAIGFYAFTIVSSIINALGSSGRIGNLLVNYRCVSNQDKSVTQGLILMLISLFALIPGPILFGRIIDSTCLVWTEQCSGRKGNCQLYDQRRFRYYINLTVTVYALFMFSLIICFLIDHTQAFLLTGIGVFFDVLVWKFGKNLDLYGEREQEMLQRKQRDLRNVRDDQ